MLIEKIMSKYFFLVFVFSIIFVSACTKEQIPQGRIMIKNDSQDSSYNIIKVLAGGLRKKLKPGEKVLLPEGVKKITLSRAYKDFTREYIISCPNQEDGILIKMIDAHLNRMPGGCKTISASR